jgi:hypothetical protein
MLKCLGSLKYKTIKLTQGIYYWIISIFISYSGDNGKKFLLELIQFSVQVEKLHLPGFWQEHQLEVSSYSVGC